MRNLKAYLGLVIIITVIGWRAPGTIYAAETIDGRATVSSVADADKVPVHSVSAGTGRATTLSTIWTWITTKLSTAALTVSTISAGAAGFSVDADGDVTGKSFTTPQSAVNPDSQLLRGPGTNGRGVIHYGPAAEPAATWSMQESATQPAVGSTDSPYIMSSTGVNYTWGWRDLHINAAASNATSTGVDAWLTRVANGTTEYKWTMANLWAWIKAKIESVVIALTDGTTATTQAAHSNDTKVATNAYVDGEFTITGTSLTAGYAYYMTTAGALAPANATSVATLPSPAVCVAVSTTACRKCGKLTTTDLTAGLVYYASTTGTGAVVGTAPSSSGNQVQRIGVASSTTVLEIMPSLDVFTVQ